MKKIYLIVVAVILALLVAAAAIDTAGYREAVNSFATEGVLANIKSSQNGIEADLLRYSACHEMRQQNPDTKFYAFKTQARECLIANSPKTQTAAGAVMFAADAREWLSVHLNDKEVAAAAIFAINNGRDNLIAEKPWRFDKMRKIAEEHDKSTILKLFFGKMNTSDPFFAIADQLSKSEYSVLEPTVTDRQSEWLLKALAAK